MMRLVLVGLICLCGFLHAIPGKIFLKFVISDTLSHKASVVIIQTFLFLYGQVSALSFLCGEDIATAKQGISTEFLAKTESLTLT